MITDRDPGVKSARPEAQAPESRSVWASIDQSPLTGDDRRLWEARVLKTAGHKGENHLLRALLDRCRGKADCFPSKQSLHADTGISKRQIQRLLVALAGRGVVALAGDPALKTGRRIIIVSHPNAKGVLDALAALKTAPTQEEMSPKLRETSAPTMNAGFCAEKKTPCLPTGDAMSPHPETPCLPKTELEARSKPEEGNSNPTTTPKSSASSSLASAGGGRLVSDDSGNQPEDQTPTNSEADEPTKTPGEAAGSTREAPKPAETTTSSPEAEKPLAGDPGGPGEKAAETTPTPRAVDPRMQGPGWALRAIQEGAARSIAMRRALEDFKGATTTPAPPVVDPVEAMEHVEVGGFDEDDIDF